MSNIPRARETIEYVIQRITDHKLKTLLVEALSMMKREPYIRRAHLKKVVITEEHVRRVHELNPNLDLSQHQIANATGLGNGARVSEILNGKRKATCSSSQQPTQPYLGLITLQCQPSILAHVGASSTRGTESDFPKV